VKGLSPLIATLLLIAFTVGVGSLISVWITGFTQTQTKTVSDQASTDIICSYGGISLSNIQYCSNRVSGKITNTGSITLGSLSLQILFTNSSNQKYSLCSSGNTVVSCTTANLTLLAREQTNFNITIGNSNYDLVRILTNCTSKYDEIGSSGITTC